MFAPAFQNGLFGGMVIAGFDLWWLNNFVGNFRLIRSYIAIFEVEFLAHFRIESLVMIGNSGGPVLNGEGRVIGLTSIGTFPREINRKKDFEIWAISREAQVKVLERSGL